MTTNLKRGTIYGSTGNPEFLYKIVSLGRKVVRVQAYTLELAPVGGVHATDLPIARARELFFNLPRVDAKAEGA